jgi:predicted RNase H-like HicB family nuclease
MANSRKGRDVFVAASPADHGPISLLIWHLGADYVPGMKLTAVFEPAKEGGYTCFVEEVPAAISEGETLEEAKKNLLEALQLVLQCSTSDAVYSF